MAPSSQANRRAKKSGKKQESHDAGLQVSRSKHVDDRNCDDEFKKRCEVLKAYYATVDRAEWWWLMDPSVDVIGPHLQEQGYVVLDGFLTAGQASKVKAEVEACHREGKLRPAGLIDGKKDLSESTYEDTTTRGDVIGWFGVEEDEWPHGRELGSYMTKICTLMNELSKHCPELAKIACRSKVMVACYPGGGARYVKHVDNDGKHPLCKTRIATVLLYINEDWKLGDGGECALFEAEDQSRERRVVEPLFNRLLIFWSDWRNPHEVRPANRMRYAVTVWFLCDAKDAPTDQPPSTPKDTSQPAQVIGNESSNGSERDKEPSRAKDAVELGQAIGKETIKDLLPTIHTENHRKCSSSKVVTLNAQDRDGVSYSWLRPETEDDGICTLQVGFCCERSLTSCPFLDLSESQVRVTVNLCENNFEQSLCLPLPFPGGSSSGSAKPKWSQRKQRLTVEFPKDADVPISQMASNLAAQLQSHGWGKLDAFLPGPEADALRNFIILEHAAGRLNLGSNPHEGAVGEAMKNDEYAFLDCSKDGLSHPLNACAKRCNRLILEIMKSNSVPGIQDVQISQGEPMIAVYPGDGSAYGPHYDATIAGKGNNGRVLTVLVYLNPFWRESDGGCIRLLQNLEDEIGIEVQPLHGRLVAFLCKNRFPHEVLPCYADRFAATFWYYDSKRLSERRM